MDTLDELPLLAAIKIRCRDCGFEWEDVVDNLVELVLDDETVCLECESKALSILIEDPNGEEKEATKPTT